MDDLNVKEEWRDVPEWDGRYSVSNLGRVRTNYIDIINQSGFCCRQKRSLIRVPKIHPKGYRYISLSEPGRRVCTGVHHLIALAFIPNPTGCRDVNHLNGIKTDNRIENLEWCTQEHNIQHAWRTGLIPVKRGEAHARAKVTEDIVRIIRHSAPDYTNNEIKYRLANTYGISICTINDILKRRSWAHVI